MRLWETHDDASDQRFPPPVPLGSKAAMRAVTPQALLAPPGEVERLREEFDGGGELRRQLAERDMEVCVREGRVAIAGGRADRRRFTRTGA